MAIFHLFSKWSPQDPEAVRRHKLAQSSWLNQCWIEKPVLDSELTRLWSEEDRSLPYVKDLLNAACDSQHDDTIVCFTNSDLIVRSDAAMMIASKLQQTDAAYAFRFDFHHKLDRVPRDNEFHQGHMYPGTDLVAFRVGWWRLYSKLLPDFILAHEAWDCVMRHLICETNPGDNELVGIACHERHGTFWENPANRYRLRGQQHNLGLAKVFFKQRGIDPGQFGIK